MDPQPDQGLAGLFRFWGFLADDTFAPPTTGGAARAVAAAAERMRANPPAFANPPATPPATDATPSESTSAEGESTSPPEPEPAPKAAQTPEGEEPRAHRLVSAAKLEEADKPSAEPPTSEDKAEAEASAYAKLLTRYGNDPEKFAAEFFKTEQRAASMAKLLKAKGGAPPAPEDAPAPEPAPALDAAVPPAEAIAAEAEAAAKADVEQWFKSDPQMKQWNAAYLTNNERLGAILTDQSGQVSGELVEVGKTITRLEGLLDPKQAGVDGIVTLDEDQREQIERRLEMQKAKRERLKVEYDNLLDANGRLERAWEARYRGATEHYRKQRYSTVDQARAAAALREEAAVAEQEWEGELNRVTSGLSKEDRAEATRRLRQALNAEGRDREEFPEFGPWMDEQMRVIRADWARREGAQAKATAQRRETINRQPAPPPTAATAERQEPPPTVDKRAARRAAELRATVLARDVRVVPVSR